MAKKIIPIIALKSCPKDQFPLEFDDIMEDLGVKHTPEDFTFTCRYTIPKEKRPLLRKALKKRAGSDKAAQEESRLFLKKLEETDWDCSFLVDTW